MSQIKQPQSFIESIQQGSLPPLEESPVVVETPYDEKEPSALGGLAALGATIVGATALGKRMPGVRNYLRQMNKPAAKVDYLPNKPVGNGPVPTATGQATDLIVQTPKTELAVIGRSRFGEVLDRPLNFGAPLQPVEEYLVHQLMTERLRQTLIKLQQINGFNGLKMRTEEI